MARARPQPDKHGAREARSDWAPLFVAPRFRPVIATARLVLRPLQPADANDFTAMIGDPAVARMLARVPHPYTRANALGFIDFASRSAAAGRALISAITLDGRLIGIASIDAIPYRCRLGYWLGRRHWRRGYGTEAVGALLAYAFGLPGVRLVRAGVYVDNAASLHVLGKLGFRSVGRRAGRSLAREGTIEHIGTVLTRARFREKAL